MCGAGSATQKASSGSIDFSRTARERTLTIKNGAAGLWGRPAARGPVWDGEGWGRDRDANLLYWRALAVVVDGGGSPSATQAFGSNCD
jgi:hypothetical protein